MFGFAHPCYWPGNVDFFTSYSMNCVKIGRWIHKLLQNRALYGSLARRLRTCLRKDSMFTLPTPFFSLDSHLSYSKIDLKLKIPGLINLLNLVSGVIWSLITSNFRKIYSVKIKTPYFIKLIGRWCMNPFLSWQQISYQSHYKHVKPWFQWRFYHVRAA